MSHTNAVGPTSIGGSFSSFLWWSLKYLSIHLGADDRLQLGRHRRRKSVLDYFTLAARNQRHGRQYFGARRRTTLPQGDRRLMGVVSERYRSLGMLFAKYDSYPATDRCH